MRTPAAALYAFCRVADDAIDLCDDKPRALADLQQRLDAVYAGAPRPMVADRALACVVQGFGIPRLLLDALLEGFAWDAAGRLFLPQQWLREAGIDPDSWLRAPSFGPGIAQVVRRLLGAADVLYARAESGVAELPRSCRPAILAARLVYAEIGRELEAAGLDSVTLRAVVSGRRKVALMARACGAALHAPSDLEASAPPLPAVRFLVDAAASNALPQRTFYDRTVRVIDMLDRVAQRQRDSRFQDSGRPFAGAD